MRDRSSYIGGSAASAIMCDNKYKTRRDVWERLAGKRKSTDLENTGHIARGNTLEPIVEDWIREHVDGTINGDRAYDEFDAGGGHGGQIFLQHPKYEWIGGHPDGIGYQCGHKATTLGEPVIYEIKTPTTYNVKKIDRHGIVGRYFWQVQHYMMITGIKESVVVIWDYNSWTGNMYYVPAEEELHAQMMEEYKDMYFCAKTGVLPEPTTEIARQSQEVRDEEELDRLLQEYNHWKNVKYEGKDKTKKLKGKILSLIDGAEVVNTPNMRASIRYNVGKYDATYLTTSERDDELAEEEYE